MMLLSQQCFYVTWLWVMCVYTCIVIWLRHSISMHQWCYEPNDAMTKLSLHHVPLSDEMHYCSFITLVLQPKNSLAINKSMLIIHPMIRIGNKINGFLMSFNLVWQIVLLSCTKRLHHNYVIVLKILLLQLDCCVMQHVGMKEKFCKTCIKIANAIESKC